jgi:hypothetical protein
MTLLQAIAVARRVMAEHGGIELEIVGMRGRMVAVNPDNPQQVECAEAYNTLSAVTSIEDMQ